MTNTRTFNYIGTKKASKWILNTVDYRFNMIMGAVRASKDYNSTIAFVETVKRADYDLFMVGAVDVKNAMRIIGRYILDYLGGLAKKTIYMEAPAITFPYNGYQKTIIFAGGKNIGSDAGIQGLTLHSIYLTEINLLNEDFVNQSIKRTSSFKDARIFGTFNPKGPKHPFRTNFLEIWIKYQKDNPSKKWLNFENFSLFDNPILDKEMIEQIKASYDPNTVSYKRDILGVETDPEGALYTIRDYNILEEIDLKNYNRYAVVVDIGESTSSTVFLIAAPYFNTEKKQFELHVLKEYKHLNNSVNDLQKKSPLQYIEEYVTFVEGAIELFGRHPDKLLFDGTDQFFRDLVKELRKRHLAQHTPKRVTKDSEEDRIYKGQSWLYQGKLKFYKYCENTIIDFRNAEHDEKVYERTGKIVTKEIYNDQGHLDCLDATNYLMTFYTPTIGGK